ncbi:MAG: hypothetical protein ACREHG_02225 [Candidatus Saccharimonadales bacterium]
MPEKHGGVFRQGLFIIRLKAEIEQPQDVPRGYREQLYHVIRWISGKLTPRDFMLTFPARFLCQSPGVRQG